jgi:membrane protein DedA with SNARE-associated domain
MLILQELVDRFTYAGILGALLLGSLGVPIPEEMPIVAAGILSHEGLMRWWLALPVCIVGALSGDAMLYWIGRRWGQRVLDRRVVRWVLTPEREAWLTARYREHAMKTVATARHVVGLRAAAFLTAGIARVQFWKFLVADAAAAAVTVPFVFALAYLFTNQVTAILADVRRVERWAALAALVGLTAAVGVCMIRSNRRISKPRERL